MIRSWWLIPILGLIYTAGASQQQQLQQQSLDQVQQQKPQQSVVVQRAVPRNAVQQSVPKFSARVSQLPATAERRQDEDVPYTSSPQYDYSGGFPDGFAQGLPSFDFSSPLSSDSYREGETAAAPEASSETGFANGPPKGFPNLETLGADFSQYQGSAHEPQHYPEYQQSQRETSRYPSTSHGSHYNGARYHPVSTRHRNNEYSRDRRRERNRQHYSHGVSPAPQSYYESREKEDDYLSGPGPNSAHTIPVESHAAPVKHYGHGNGAYRAANYHNTQSQYRRSPSQQYPQYQTNFGHKLPGNSHYSHSQSHGSTSYANQQQYPSVPQPEDQQVYHEPQHRPVRQHYQQHGQHHGSVSHSQSHGQGYGHAQGHSVHGHGGHVHGSGYAHHGQAQGHGHGGGGHYRSRRRPTGHGSHYMGATHPAVFGHHYEASPGGYHGHHGSYHEGHPQRPVVLKEQSEEETPSYIIANSKDHFRLREKRDTHKHITSHVRASGTKKSESNKVGEEDDMLADGTDTFWDVRLAPLVYFDSYKKSSLEQKDDDDRSIQHHQNNTYSSEHDDSRGDEQRFFPSFPAPSPYLGLGVGNPFGAVGHQARPPLFPGPTANRSPSRYHPQFGTNKYSPPPNRGPSSAYAESSHDRYHDTNLLGSGNFEVVRGGTYYSDDDDGGGGGGGFHGGFHHPQDEDDGYYHHNGHSSGYRLPGGDFFANFRDFADINPPSRSFSHNHETLHEIASASSRHQPRNILDKLESSSDPVPVHSLAISRESDPMMATF